MSSTDIGTIRMDEVAQRRRTSALLFEWRRTISRIPGRGLGGRGLGVLAGDHAADRAHELLRLFVGIARPALTADQAVADVAVQQPQPDLVQRRPGGID